MLNIDIEISHVYIILLDTNDASSLEVTDYEPMMNVSRYPPSLKSENMNIQEPSDSARTGIDIDKGSQAEKMFVNKAATDCYKENSFPNPQSRTTYEKINTKLYCIKPDLVQLAIKLLKKFIHKQYLHFILD